MCALLLFLSQKSIANNEPELPNIFTENAFTPSPAMEDQEAEFNKRGLDPLIQTENLNNADDLNTAETLVFRPLFGSRYLVNRRRGYYGRRFYRSLEDPSEDLNTDETLVFRPFFGRRFGFHRRHFPYYYYYY